MRIVSGALVVGLVVGFLPWGSAARAQAAPPAAGPQQAPPGYPGGYPPPYPGVAAYPPPVMPPPPPPVAEKMLGVGYKAGNGLGFVGADLIIAPIEHLAFDLQLNHYSSSEAEGTASGWGFAPSVQGRLNGGQRSTPYAALGLAHISLSLNDVTASGTAVFANAGYEWRWDQGFGILLGGGIAHLGAITATDNVTSISVTGGWFPNIEIGLRYMFL